MYTYTQRAAVSAPQYRRSKSSRTSHSIAITDKVYARLSMGGRVVAELTRDKIASYTTLLTVIRSLTPNMRGLARLYVRNMTQGWSLDKPLMLYAREQPQQAPQMLMPWQTH